jgi:hypothetical protein
MFVYSSFLIAVYLYGTGKELFLNGLQHGLCGWSYSVHQFWPMNDDGRRFLRGAWAARRLFHGEIAGVLPDVPDLLLAIAARRSLTTCNCLLHLQRQPSWSWGSMSSGAVEPDHAGEGRERHRPAGGSARVTRAWRWARRALSSSELRTSSSTSMAVAASAKDVNDVPAAVCLRRLRRATATNTGGAGNKLDNKMPS